MFRLWPVTLAAATVLALLSAVLLKVGRAAVGTPITWAQAITGAADWYVWALLVPVVAYLARRFPIDPQRPGKGLAIHVPVGIGVAALELAAFAAVNHWYNRAVLGTPLRSFYTAYVSIISQWMPVALLIYALIVAMVTAVIHSQRARAHGVAAARLETEVVRAQLHALQAQIQPHFLFNTLNTVSNLVRASKRDTAVAVMATLGRFLRRTMELTGEMETTLDQELAFVRDYLDVERHRMGDRLDVEYHIDPAAMEARVPTMVLQPLVENAVIHGIEQKTDGGTITVRANRRDGWLDIDVADNGLGFDGAAEGLGTRNVRDRLRAHYGASGTLDIRSEPGRGTHAKIKIPVSIETQGRS